MPLWRVVPTMRIDLQTWGSHGDIRPFVALAAGLQAAGHQVRLVVTCVDSRRYEALRAQAIFDLRVVASPVVADAQTLQAVGERIVAERDGIRQTRQVIGSPPPSRACCATSTKPNAREPWEHGLLGKTVSLRRCG
ncbi:hypothetical protein [Inhella sp.]|uniref:hypothetical protein n=1 Tax=Inhella sp. TaxID=1921806 RepID=UPI0035ADFF97